MWRKRAHPVTRRVPILANHFRQADEDPYRQARPGCWPTYEPDSAVRDLRWVVAGIVALLLVAWGSGGLS